MDNEIIYTSEDFETEDLTVSENDFLLSSLMISSGSDFNGYSLDTFDRIISGIPSYYGYYGIINESDAYLYYGSESSVNGSNVFFGIDCKEVHIYVDESDNFQFETVAAPSSSFIIGSFSICYTNLISGYPTLGDNELSLSAIAAVGLIASALVIVFNRSSRR